MCLYTVSLLSCQFCVPFLSPVTERWNRNLNCSVPKKLYNASENPICSSFLLLNREIMIIQIPFGDMDSCVRHIVVNKFCSHLNLKLYKLGLFPKLKFQY